MDSRAATSSRGDVLIFSREKLRVQEKNGELAKLRKMCALNCTMFLAAFEILITLYRYIFLSHIR